MTLHVVVAGDRLGGVEVESTHEHRQPAEQDPFGSVSSACDQSTDARKRLLARHCGARAAGQQPETVMEAVEDLGQRQARTRAAASSMANGMPSSRRQISVTEAVLSSVTVKSGRARRARSVNKLDRLVGERQRRHAPRHLAGHPDRLAAGRQHRHAGARAEQRALNAALASRRCSQLSSTISIVPVGDGSEQGSIAERPGWSAARAREPP